jgi:hypothetical protein
MDLNDVSVFGSGPGTIRFTLEDTSFGGASWPSWTQRGLVGGTLSGPAGSTITAQDWVNTSNSVIALGSSTAAVGAISALGGIPSGSLALAGSPFVAGPGAFASDTSSTFSAAGPFSMFQQVTVNLTGAGVVSFDNHHIAAIPEPETYAMMLAGLGLMAFIARRRKQNNAT